MKCSWDSSADGMMLHLTTCQVLGVWELYYLQNIRKPMVTLWRPSNRIACNKKRAHVFYILVKNTECIGVKTYPVKSSPIALIYRSRYFSFRHLLSIDEKVFMFEWRAHRVYVPMQYVWGIVQFKGNHSHPGLELLCKTQCRSQAVSSIVASPLLHKGR